MTARSPNVFNIVAGAPFLETLAKAVLEGFPIKGTALPLSDWTILLPTRRAAKAFGEILLSQSEKKALILPRIQPIGDLDEDRLQDEMVDGDLLPAMSSIATLVEITRLIKNWALKNQHLNLAHEIILSPAQAVNLAQSLVDIIVSKETYQFPVSDLIQFYHADIAEHRQTITSLLELVLTQLPQQQASEFKIGATARRSSMIRAEAKRIAQGGHKGPIIAAGSTGSIPVTRELLAAIARHPQGAVILPGLDQSADEASWLVITEEHPQFTLKELIDELGVTRNQVQILGSPSSPRNRLMSEVFRPTETTPQWHKNLPTQRENLAVGVQGITEIACPDRHIEARVIATILRESLTHKSRSAALVTPDRDLAVRVVAEMDRWGISVFDSAGEALSRRGLGAALDLLLQAQLDEFATVKLFAFLRHPQVTLGLDASTYLHTLQHFELAVLRGPFILAKTYSETLNNTQIRAANNSHLHPSIRALSETQWEDLKSFAEAIDHLLSLFINQSVGLASHLAEIDAALRFACGEDAFVESEAPVLDLLEELKVEGHRRPDASKAETIVLLLQILHAQKQYSADDSHPHLSILGTLEARLLPFDVVVLGGLNETIWPKSADPGPWLNRAMRKTLKLPMPERALGLTAHDFEQAISASKVYVTWSKRLGNAPQSPSRWLLRLKAVLETAGVTPPDAGHWLTHTQSLSQSATLTPLQKPAFAPPITARPTRFSVTEVEKLIRNPYAIYAKRVLKLEPLPGFAERPDVRARGSLFHEAIGKWNDAQSPSLTVLLSEGDKALATLGQAEMRHFWAPHFRRLATFLWNEQIELRENLLKIHAECNGKLNFEHDGVAYTLTARADRIDILENAVARIIDYKTGTIPTTKQVDANFSPQLTLQAAILLQGGFTFKPKAVVELIYFKIGGGRDGLKKQFAIDGSPQDIADLADAHFSSFKSLLATYQDAAQPYLPRLMDEKEEEAQDYDHLSRYLEWQLAEQK